MIALKELSFVIALDNNLIVSILGYYHVEIRIENKVIVLMKLYGIN